MLDKVIIIDKKMNTVVVEVNPMILKSLGIKQDDVKKHKSRRQLDIEITDFLKML